jgi:DNA-binding transcriptional LysR family regulator
MRRKIPNTWALTAFEAAARHQSFTKAASELDLTQSAVCRQIAGLEEFLGLPLFHRTKRGVALTEAGLTYSRQVAVRLNAVELAVVPTFATKWLMPRLAQFQRDNPDVTVNLTPRVRPFLFNETEFDAAIHCGEANWPGAEARCLMRENLVPVCSPRLIAPHAELTAQQMRDYPLLQQSTRPYAWRQWFAALGMEVEHDMAGPRYELFSMLSQAAMLEMGIALIPPFLIEDELKQGLLTVPLRQPFVSDRSYYLIYPERSGGSAALAHFRDWLEAEAQAYRREAGLDLP